MLSRRRMLSALAAAALSPAGARAVDLMRGVLPPGPAAPVGVTVWEFASGKEQPEVTTFLYLTNDGTTVRLRMTPPDPMIRSVEVYANGRLAARMDGDGLVDGRKPDGFKHGDGPPVSLSVGLRRGLNRITLLPRYASELEDSVDAPRPAWSGFATFGSGRLVELTLMFRGLENFFGFQSRIYSALRRFDQELRVGHPLEPQIELARTLQSIEAQRGRLERDRSVWLVLTEADRLYLESWKEPGGGDRFLAAQIDAARALQRGWSSPEPMFVAHEIYRSARKRSSIYEALTDVALSKQNLRNACAVLATRAGETVPENLRSVILLMQQDNVLLDALERQVSLMAPDLAQREAEILKAYPQWRERFLFAYHTVIRSRKTVPPDYPSALVVQHETRVVRDYLEDIRQLLLRDIAYGRLVTELASTMVEPRAFAPGLPKRTW